MWVGCEDEVPCDVILVAEGRAMRAVLVLGCAHTRERSGSAISLRRAMFPRAHVAPVLAALRATVRTVADMVTVPAIETNRSISIRWGKCLVVFTSKASKQASRQAGKQASKQASKQEKQARKASKQEKREWWQ